MSGRCSASTTTSQLPKQGLFSSSIRLNSISSFHELCRYIVALSTPLDMIGTRATLVASKCHNVSVLNIDDIYEYILKVFSWINSMLISLKRPLLGFYVMECISCISRFAICSYVCAHVAERGYKYVEC